MVSDNALKSNFALMQMTTNRVEKNINEINRGHHIVEY